MKALILTSALLLGDFAFADETIEVDTFLQVQACEKNQVNCTENSTPGEGKIVLHEDTRGRLMGASIIKSTVAGVNFKFVFAITKDRTNTYTVSTYYATGDIESKENQGKIIGRYFVTDLSQIVEQAWFGQSIETDNLVLTPYFVNSRLKNK